MKQTTFIGKPELCNVWFCVKYEKPTFKQISEAQILKRYDDDDRRQKDETRGRDPLWKFSLLSQEERGFQGFWLIPIYFGLSFKLFSFTYDMEDWEYLRIFLRQILIVNRMRKVCLHMRFFQMRCQESVFVLRSATHEGKCIWQLGFSFIEIHCKNSSQWCCELLTIRVTTKALQLWSTSIHLNISFSSRTGCPNLNKIMKFLF